MNSPRTVTAEQFHEIFTAIRQEMSKAVVGLEQAIEYLLAAFFAEGHILITGLPGLGRTLIVNTLAQVLQLRHSRLQFTPDLLPSDIIGAEILVTDTEGNRMFKFYEGPVFANLVLADELNRSPARTQSALLEVMQERQVTAGGNTFKLPDPFTLIATLNTLESEGVWNLGEAQVDRFMMSIPLAYPTEEEERSIIEYTTGIGVRDVKPVADAETVIAMQRLAENVPVVPSVKDFALSIVRASRVGQPEAPAVVSESVRLGASTRAAQALIRGAKVLALARGRRHVTRQDVIDIVPPVLNHRLILDYRAQVHGHSVEEILDAAVKAAWERILPKSSSWTQKVLRRVL